ncbi:MAG: hypothetical protein Q4P36_01855 [Bowdeniella nasicola]|nr:hypothetical protein [Bowdeniella nasicola]
MSSRTPPRRPALWEPANTERIPGGPDPERVYEAAHASAQALLDLGRSTSNREEHRRLVSLVQDEGIEVLANVWSTSAAVSLPGALWRLYLIREWIRTDSAGVAHAYNRGLEAHDVDHAIAGVPPLHGPSEVSETIDAILTGAFDGELDVAFDRAASLARVAAAGVRSDHGSGTRPERRLTTLARDLTLAARAQRRGALYVDAQEEE